MLCVALVLVAAGDVQLTIEDLRKLAAQKRDAAKAIHDAAETDNRDLTPEESAEFDSLIADAKSANARADRMARLTVVESEVQRPRPQTSAAVGVLGGDLQIGAVEPDVERPRSEPARPKRYGNLTAFKGPDADIRAYRFGAWAQAVGGGSQKAVQYCRTNGIPILSAGQEESDNTSGGVFVPEEFDTDIINLKEEFGVARRLCRRSPMTSDYKSRNRRTGGMTASFTSETGAAAVSTLRWDQVALIAKKLTAMGQVSMDLDADSRVNMGDQLGTEIAYAFSNKEDECFVNGDSTSTYGHITGLSRAFLSLTGTIANIAGLAVGSGDTWPELALVDFEAVVAKLPLYADTPNARWLVHKTFYWAVMQKLKYAAGGNDTANLSAGTPQTFMGYEVVYSQVMPKVTGVSQICAYLGDFTLGVDFGDRKGTEITFSKDATVGGVNAFETDQMFIKGVERFDLNVHDVGNQSATAASRQPGPIVGLITAAS